MLMSHHFKCYYQKETFRKFKKISQYMFKQKTIHFPYSNAKDIA